MQLYRETQPCQLEASILLATARYNTPAYNSPKQIFAQRLQKSQAASLGLLYLKAGDTTQPNQSFTKEQLRVTQPGRLHSHTYLFGEHIKTPLSVILQTWLSHSSQDYSKARLRGKQTQAQYFVTSSLISTPRGTEESEKKAYLKSCFNFISKCRLK